MRAWTAEKRGRQSRLGHLLALVALCLQLVAPALSVPRAAPSDQGDFGAFLRLHALCFGGNSTPARSGVPARDQSDRTGSPCDACCFLHGCSGAFLVPPSIVRPVAFTFLDVSFSAPATAPIATRPLTTPRARAPPSEA